MYGKFVYLHNKWRMVVHYGILTGRYLFNIGRLLADDHGDDDDDDDVTK